MKCAPVLIITLNRYMHLKRCIESLRRSSLAKQTDLYIGLDYPPDSRYEEGYKKVKEYLDGGIEGFREVIIIKQCVNKGVFGNFAEVQKEVYKKYDRFIYSEDDNEFSINYLEYMNRCFEKYEKDDRVLAVSGYGYPIETGDFRGNVFKCGTYFSALGYGTWKWKEDKMREYLNLDFFRQMYKDNTYMKKLSDCSKNQYVNMIKGMLEYTPDLISQNRIREVDLAFGLYMVATKRKMIFPVVSKVRNWGFDGTGVNCGQISFKQNMAVSHRNFDFENQILDEREEFPQVIEETAITEEKINALIDVYFSIPKKEYVRAKTAYILSRIVGIENVRRMIGKKYK